MADTEDESLAKMREALSNVTDRILEVMTNPRPNYSIDGQSVDHGDFLDQLLKARDLLKKQIQELEGPWEIESQMYS